MPDQLQLRGGTTAQHASFTGASKEITVDTTKKTVVVHDGSTAGGNPVMREDGANSSLALGSASSPSLKWDANTGLYSPGADQVAISTNGTGRLFVDASGNVGVGGSSNVKLQVNSGDIRIVQTDSNANNGLYFRNAVDSATFAKVAYKAATGELEVGTTDAYSLLFLSNNAERMRLDASGRLGLGTSSPSDKLSVYTSSASDTVIGIGNTAGNGWAGYLTGGGDLLYGLQTAGNVAIRTNNTNRIYVTSAGNVGIGTTQPQYRAHIQSEKNTSQVFLTANSLSSPGDYLQYGFGANPDTGSSLYGAIRCAFDNPAGTSNTNLQFLVNSGEKARLTSDGKFLVGTSTAQGTYALQIESSGNSVFLRRNLPNGSLGDGNGLGTIDFGNQSGGIGARIEAVADAGWGAGGNDYPSRLVFSTTADGASSPTERMRITNQGVVGTFSTSNSFVFGTSQGAGTSVAFLYGRHSSSNWNDGTNTFIVWTNGNVVNTNNSYGAISDIKLKENIVDANSQWDDLKALQVRNYNFKKGQTHTQIGLVAQEAELVSPGLVSESPDRDEEGNDLGTVTKSVNYSVLYMKAVKALQEAMERIEQLETEMAAVKAQLS